jgi:hypothetical protein
MDRLEGMRKHSRPLVFNTQHLGDVRAMEIQVKQADIFTMVCKGEREVYRDRGFSHTALPAEHEDNVFNINLCFWR